MTNHFGKLTEQELQVMLFIAKGLRNKEICNLMDKTPAQVSMRRRNALRKLRLKNNADLVRYCVLHYPIEMEIPNALP